MKDREGYVVFVSLYSYNPSLSPLIKFNFKYSTYVYEHILIHTF